MSVTEELDQWIANYGSERIALNAALANLHQAQDRITIFAAELAELRAALDKAQTAIELTELRAALDEAQAAAELAELRAALNFCIDEIEKWNAGKTHDIGAAFEATVTAVAEAKA